MVHASAFSAKPPINEKFESAQFGSSSFIAGCAELAVIGRHGNAEPAGRPSATGAQRDVLAARRESWPIVWPSCRPHEEAERGKGRAGP